MSDPLHIWSVDRMLVCVPAQLPDAVVGSLRALLAAQPSADAVLDLITADGIAATPPFLCAEMTTEGVRVVIRGDLQAVAHGLDGSSLVLGAGRAVTWNDDVVTDIVSIAFDHGDGGGRFEWLTRTGTAPPPVRAAGSHTLGEEEFLRLVVDEEPVPEPEPVPDPEAVPEPELVPEAVPVPEPDPVPEPEAVPVPEPGAPDFSSLLDHTSHERVEEPVPPPPVVPAPAVAPVSEPTQVRPVGVEPPPPATRTPISAVPASGAASTAPPASPPVGSGTGLGEHDGRTVTLADLRRLQEEAGATAAVAPTAVADDGPARPREVRAVRCPSGHTSPPTATSCRLCGGAIVDTTVTHVPRPVIARLVFDSGLVVEVDRPQLIGRRPTAAPDADEIPNLLTVPSPDSDISRVHTAVRVEGWDVLVEDVGSTNGTEVRLPSRDPVRLREHEPVLVVVGTEVTLAGTVRFRIEAPEQ